ncbi:hypothetical protein [Aeromonas hydrophila]|uniref:hypothetical protein n=1 Tax=Aeromonas hydrophila TaxID=644 RepID=UPI00080ABDF8|nr:hypothetical protein [Aeromonas hydrophila]ANT70224.1 hypothetical protein TK34_22415 [Aeromonas hydrophila]
MAAVAQISARQLLLLDLKLEKVNNWGASSAVNNASDTTYATAGAVKKAYDVAAAALPATANAVSATKLETSRTFALTGDATATATFDGSANVDLSVVLKDTGVSAGTWSKVTVDTKGRVTAGAALVAADIPALPWNKITSGKPTTLAGYGITDALASDGTAAAATKLATARTLTVGNTGKAFDGTANVAWTLADIGAYAAAGGGITGDFWRASGTNQFGLVDHLGTSTDAKPCLVLLAKKYVGTPLSKTGFIGRIFFNRGSNGSSLHSDFVEVNVASAYITNLARLLHRVGGTVATAKIVEVTHGGEVYYALYRYAASAGEVVVTGHAFDATLPLLIADATAYAITDVVTKEENYHAGNKPTPTDVGLGSVDDAQQMRAAFLNGYWGLVDAGGSATNYIRTPSSGLIPFKSGGASTLGSSTWPFLSAYINTVYEGGTTLAAKYLGIDANAVSASKWAAARTITLDGHATGNVSLDGSTNVTLTVTVKDGSHAHTIDNVDGLQQALDSKSPSNHTHPGTLTNPISLAREDLNTIITPRIYRQDSDANAAAALNYPEPKAGSLTVTTGAGVQQRYHVYNTSRIYTRAQYGAGAFTPWARDYNTLNRPTLDELGAYSKTGGYLDGGIDAKDSIYARVGLIARSRAGSTWLAMETPDSGDPYISARANGENNLVKVVSFEKEVIRFNKATFAASAQIGLDAGLRFAPNGDFSGTTWGLGINAETRTLGLHRYENGNWNASPFWVTAAGGVGMNGLVVAGGSESSYHQVKNAGNPSVELHEPGKFAVMMYKPQGTSTIRFVQSNGAGGEAKAYGVVDADGFGTIEGRFRATYPAANRSWAGIGQCQFWGENLNSGNGALIGLVGHRYTIPGKYAMEHILGSYLSDNPDLSTFVLSACDGGSYRRTWQFRNNGEVIAPQGWSINSAGEMYPSRLGGTNLIDWVMANFTNGNHTHTAAQGNRDIVAGGWGQIGTYMMAAVIPGHAAAMNPADGIAGSSLRPANCSEWGQNRTWALPGTWKCLGYVSNNDDDRWDDRTTLFIRVA